MSFFCNPLGTNILIQGGDDGISVRVDFLSELNSLYPPENYSGQLALVRKRTIADAIILRKTAGVYESNGTDWIRSPTGILPSSLQDGVREDISASEKVVGEVFAKINSFIDASRREKCVMDIVRTTVDGSPTDTIYIGDYKANTEPAHTTAVFRISRAVVTYDSDNEPVTTVLTWAGVINNANPSFNQKWSDRLTLAYEASNFRRNTVIVVESNGSP